MNDFSSRLTQWQREHGRHHLPWQVDDAYRVWLSEIMLQQTQVTTVLDYYARFLERFPTLTDLAAAPLDDVLALWSGLGYYTRARNLHACAQAVVRDFGGHFPSDPALIATLPGIGRSTAAAIAAFAYGTRAAILDGNVKRVLSRWAGIEGFTGVKAIENQLWELAESLLPEPSSDQNIAAAAIKAHTQGLMDLGATICTPKNPTCLTCPLSADCQARLSGRQAELPTKKPKKTVPEKSTVMVLLRNANGEILLERRPPTGIWGGLWSLPEVASTLTAATAIDQRFGLTIEIEPALPEFVHVFTHYRLTITPQPAYLIGNSTLRENHTAWFSKTAALTAGIPSPLRKIINAL
ncbi:MULTISPECIES: A/G-specific adenine glycosylase [Deefgea]|uniref:Adenine DNA glycosylase n=1 Tax=Deefgea chitinilytica TaxID=570276 RepID=A0ABS2CAP3_9NEIS|nr:MULTISPECIES: A/G-specific adenine glycosylase [Deefgea]MBM5571214.1 A/G-specific adenine glycosylase [Deefgea chitinilytica]MBM9888446.1 A/G-specific adenine glycosylase [Deefgea sp. CFH1-16]